MVEFIVPLRKEIKDSLTSRVKPEARYAKYKGPPQEGKKGKMEQILLSERAHKQF